MKKIYLLLVMVTAVLFTKAQTVSFFQTASNPTGAITNTSVDTMTLSLSKGYQVLSIQPVVTKATGTMAGTAILYSSVNGTNYVSTGDTLTLANSTTNTAVWRVEKPAKYFRILVGGATTVTGTASAKLLIGN